MAILALISTDPEVLGFEDPDLAPLAEALRAAGHTCTVESWIDESVDWSAFDLAIIRSPWDYIYQSDRFLEWLDSAGAQTTILNPPALIKWNVDKTYLLTLDHLGVPVVPTLIASTLDEANESIAAVKDSGFVDVVVKPTVSAGSRDTGLFGVDDQGAVDLASRIIELGKQVMVQPAIPSVAELGERGLVFFNGTFSHAFIKGPLLAHGGGLQSGDEYVETLTIVDPTEEELETAQAVLNAITQVGPGLDGVPPLYGRIDLVSTPEGSMLMEAELFEPSYNVHLVPGAAERFVAAVEARL